MAEPVEFSQILGSYGLPLLTIIIGIVLIYVVKSAVSQSSDPDSKECPSDHDTTVDVKPSSNSSNPKKTKVHLKRVRKEAFTHPWLSTTLKGHGGRVIDFDLSPNGKYALSTSEDRTLFMWSVKEFNQKEHKFSRGNVFLDSASRVKFTPDSKAFLASLTNENTVRVFILVKKDDSSPLQMTPSEKDFPKGSHQSDIISVEVATTGNFVMTCDSESTIIVWSKQGEVLAQIDTKLGKNHHASVSPCGRFIAASGFTPEVKLWEVKFSGGDFVEVKRAYELKGHSAGVYHFSFSGNSLRAATVSKDQTWKSWNVDVDHKQGEDASILRSAACPQGMSDSPLLALSKDGRTLALASVYDIWVYVTASGDQVLHIPDVHTDPITCVRFTNSNRYFMTSGDRHIHVFHNVTGFKATIDELLHQKKGATTGSMKDRIDAQIKEARKLLQSIEGK